jgi:hypothetical protein
MECRELSGNRHAHPVGAPAGAVHPNMPLPRSEAWGDLIEIAFNRLSLSRAGLSFQAEFVAFWVGHDNPAHVWRLVGQDGGAEAHQARQFVLLAARWLEVYVEPVLDLLLSTEPCHPPLLFSDDPLTRQRAEQVTHSLKVHAHIDDLVVFVRAWWGTTR